MPWICALSTLLVAALAPVGSALSSRSPPGAVIKCLPESAEDECECLQWACAYGARDIHCGQSLELYLFDHGSMDAAVRSAAETMVGEWICGSYYERLSDNMCRNVGMHNMEGKRENGQWCMVSARCNRTRGGGQIGMDFKTKWKLCDASDPADKNKMTRSMTPYELMAMSRSSDLDAALHMKFAYPTWEGQVWDDVRAFWEGGDTDSMGPILRYRLQEVVDSGVPMIFNVNQTEHLPPWYVVQGIDKVWMMENASHSNTHRGSWRALRCLQGCTTTTTTTSTRFTGITTTIDPWDI